MVIISTLSALIAGELFFRLHPGLNRSSSFVLRKATDGMGETLNRLPNLYRPSFLLGYEFIPRSIFFPGVSINSYGLIGNEYNLQKGKDIFRILILGDSIAEQPFTAEFLEMKWNNSSKKKYRLEVWNAGVGGYDIRKYALYLRNKGMQFKPDMVIVYISLDDFVLNTCVYYKDEKGFWVANLHLQKLNKYYTPNRFLLENSYLYRYIILALDNYLLRLESRGKNQSSFGRNDPKFYLKQIKDDCARQKIPLLCVIFPYLYSDEEYTTGNSNCHRTILDALRALKIDYIDLHEHWFGEMRPGLGTTSMDPVHPSKEGHRLAVDTLYDYLITKNYLKNQKGKL